MPEGCSVGVVMTLKQNVVYATPARRCKFHTHTAAPTLVCSDDVSMATTTAVTLTEGAYEVTAAFIKSTAGDCVGVFRPV